MNFTIGKAKTKRGTSYNTRPTKVANGYSKVLADRERIHRGFREKEGYEEKTRILLSLAVRGTTDPLGSMRFYVKSVIKHHPDDPSYTKRVLVLNDRGHTKVERKRRWKTRTIEAS